MLKREWGAESNEKLPHLFIPGKTTALVPELVAKDLPSAELQSWIPVLAVKDLPLDRTLMMIMKIREILKLDKIQDEIEESKIRWYGHVKTMNIQCFRCSSMHRYCTTL